MHERPLFWPRHVGSSRVSPLPQPRSPSKAQRSPSPSNHLGLKRLLLWLALPLAAVACAPSYASPCTARPGFDQKVRRDSQRDPAEDEPGVAHIPSPASQADLPETLSAIAQALRNAPDDRSLNISVELPLAYFEGLTCVQILAPFHAAKHCRDDPREVWIPLHHLPDNRAGGGRNLILHFDEDGRCDGARWCFTQ